ncbi:MAG: type I-E CRISPR-associated protein Cas7/Cse4/CasC [Proteobacteria bacterium]|nr:type I-E CRISPR-associated protein Cas7/Cse4/CasC [Pseudomonadota bacterium]
MTLPRFIQIHTLHNYPAALLNRDDAGLAKRLPYGDKVRTRISSQCLKRHWRKAEDAFSLSGLDVPMAIRSRAFVDRIGSAMRAEGVDDQVADAVALALRDALKKPLDKLIKDAGKKKTPKKGKKAEEVQDDEDDEGDAVSGEQKQAILLGVAEYEYLTRACVEVAKRTSAAEARLALLSRLKAEHDNLKQLPLNSGLESALFGRMVTSDVLASRDAAVYVAHAFTVHEAQVENDYFTVVDDLLQEAGEAGSAGIFDTELASGLYYGYVVVDVPQLVANLEGVAIKDWNTATPEQRALAGRVVQHLLHLVATVSPGAKRGSTAPFAWAKFMLVEAGNWQPRSLAGAFQNALPSSQPALRKAAVQRLSDEIAQMDAAYGAPLSRRFLAVDDVQVPGAERLTLKALAEWAQAAVTRAEA